MAHLIACQSTSTHVVHRIPGRCIAYCGQSYINHTRALAARRSIYNEYIAKPDYNAIVGVGTRGLLCSTIDMANADRPTGWAGAAVGRPSLDPSVRALCDNRPTTWPSKRGELAAT